jgi:hypothetical protein
MDKTKPCKRKKKNYFPKNSCCWKSSPTMVGPVVARAQKQSAYVIDGSRQNQLRIMESISYVLLGSNLCLLERVCPKQRAWQWRGASSPPSPCHTPPLLFLITLLVHVLSLAAALRFAVAYRLRCASLLSVCLCALLWTLLCNLLALSLSLFASCDLLDMLQLKNKSCDSWDNWSGLRL